MTEKDLLQSYMTEMRRGSLTLAVLALLHQPYYGYALLQKMQDSQLEIEANTLYPLLRRLEKQGLLTSDWDTSESRPRKYYLLSALGSEIYQQLRKEAAGMHHVINHLIKENEK